MPTKKSAISPEIYQIKVTLPGTSPPIWRRLLVPAEATLAQLHGIVLEKRLSADPNTAYPPTSTRNCGIGLTTSTGGSRSSTGAAVKLQEASAAA